jgi:hypothetical protein
MTKVLQEQARQKLNRVPPVPDEKSEVLTFVHRNAVSSKHSDVCKGLTQLWYPDTKDTPYQLLEYTTGRQYICTKQVPSALAIRCPGSFSVKKNLDLLLNSPFSVDQLTDEGWKEIVPGKAARANSWIGSSRSSDKESDYQRIHDLSSIFMPAETDVKEEKDEKLPDVDEDTVVSWGNLKFWDEKEEPGPELKDIQAVMQEQDTPAVPEDERDTIYRIHYRNVFHTLQGYQYTSDFDKPKPAVFVWSADVKRLTDTLHPSFFGLDTKNRISFVEVRDLEKVIDFLKIRTFWGYRIQQDIKDHDKWSKILWKRIRAFLGGKPDPTWSKKALLRYYGHEFEIRNTVARRKRFLQMLKTVDGLWAQRFLAVPEENWDWEKYESFVINAISMLIGDEFFDGELKCNPESIKTFYKKVKEVRKTFKRLAHLNQLDQWLLATGRIDEDGKYVKHHSFPVFLRYWDKLVRIVQEAKMGHRKIRMIGLLSQTRAAGTPPAIVTLQSKIKFLRTVSTPAPPLSETEKLLINSAADHVMRDLPERAFTGLRTKARISLTDSACFEHTRAEYGTLHAIQEIVKRGKLKEPVPLRDLQRRGAPIIGKLYLNKDGVSEGEYIFWACLSIVLRTNPEKLRRVSMVIVNEPGKARIVTKSMAALKVVLDVVSKICSFPLKRGIPSSESGMGKSDHAWNLYKAFFTIPYRDILFFPEDVWIEHDNQRTARKEYVYKPAFISSTDYETATDGLYHEVAAILSNKWMLRCGIPSVLRGIVNAVGYRDRTVQFTGTGYLEQFGEYVDGHTRQINLKRGVLMGDPMTKPVLHLVNICVRSLPMQISEGSQSFYNIKNVAQMRDLLHGSLRLRK